ncbi:site-specific integrase [Brevibacillus sp. Leaf182]|uniref:site-specific integrase n=1 Tax=Brevibacillus sp. Leaf182 TaxID=1736290 RepID=UPI0006F2AF92|nr:site-specific integrase [Brevibacillus sp. Leaf182]RAT99183.1 site-specific integrase [Brevibacillus sp. Leaf182]
MYKYLNEVQPIIFNYLETIPNDDSKVFYQSRLFKFFDEYMSKEHNLFRPLNTINFYDINTFLDELEFSSAEKLNYYNAFSGFFKFAYLTDRLPVDVMKGVNKPIIELKPKRYIADQDVKIIKKFIFGTGELEDRFLLALFLFTGLSRKYIANLTHYNFSRGNLYTSLFFEIGERTRCVPLNQELVKIVSEYFESLAIINPYQKVFKHDENYVSEKVSSLSKKITGKPYTPTSYSNTFIREVLIQNNDILTVSQLTLESISTIAKHVKNDDQEIVKKQLETIERLFKDVDSVT